MAKNDNVYYISLVQDLPPAKAEELNIHDQKVTFVKIPNGAKLSEFKDKKLDSINNQSKIYFCAHGIQTHDTKVFSMRSEKATIYSLDEVAELFSKLLSEPQFKDPNKQRVALVFSVCQGTGFAKKLQKMLLDKYGIFVDVIANKHIVHEYYSYDENKPKMVNIMYRESSNNGKDSVHKRPHSKVLLTIDENGNQKETDMYELKWISKVVTTLNAQLQNFLKWADFNSSSNVDIAKNLTDLTSQINTLIKENIEKDITLTANLISDLLSNIELDPTGFKHETIFPTIVNLIKEGKKYVNDKEFNRAAYQINSNTDDSDVTEDTEDTKDTEDFSEREYVERVLQAQKVKLSSLIEEAANAEVKTVYLEEIDEVNNKISEIKSVLGKK